MRPAPCRISLPSSSISVEELAQWRAQGRDFILLDVREPFELAAARIEGALHIPLRDLPSRLGDLKRDGEMAVICHRGHRSDYAARFLAAQGFVRVHNVDGGIAAYAERVDASVGSY